MTSDYQAVAYLIDRSRAIAITIGYSIKKLADHLVNSIGEGGCPLPTQCEAAFRLDHDESVGIGERADIIHRESGFTTDGHQPGGACKPWHWLVRDD